MAQAQSPQQVGPSMPDTAGEPILTQRPQISPGIVANPETAADTSRAAEPAPPLSRDGALTKQRIETLVKSGDIERSRSLFSSYMAASPAVSERATLSLSYGNSLAKAAKTADQPALLDEARTYLRYAFENGAQREQVVARNNYATIALEQGRIDEGLAVMREGYALARDLPDGAARARYLYNYAKAVQRHGDPTDAVAIFQQSYESDPGLVRAAEDGIEVAARSKNPPAAAGLLRALIENGHLSAAEAKLRTLLQRRELAAQRRFAEVVEVFYELLPAAQVTPEMFEKNWRGFLSETRTQLSSRAKDRLSLVFSAYDPDLPTVFISPEARVRYTPWVGDPTDSRVAAEVLGRPSRFMAGIGEVFEHAEKLDRALALYATAWALDTSNLTAGLYAANLLLAYPGSLDPDGRYMQKFIINLFEGKGKAYLGEDLPNILRFHTILGTIFSAQGRWGDSRTIQSAIFQWEHALQASRRLLEAGREEEGAAPGLYAKLAEAYGAVGRGSDAFDSYLQGANESLKIGNDDLAREIVFERILSLQYNPSPAQRERLSALQRRLSG